MNKLEEVDTNSVVTGSQLNISPIRTKSSDDDMSGKSKSMDN